MDEVEEAHELFQLALKIDPRSAPALTHSAENEIQKSNFEGALQLLLKAKQSAQSDQVTMRLHKLKVATSQLFGNNTNGQVSSSLSFLQQTQIVERIGQEAQQNLLSSVISLLALSRFRVSPTSPEVSL
jgi:Tfp pilus assembly protein PilF